MNLRKNILTTLLLAIGFVLSQITPPFLGGMRFDFLLSFMFISIMLTKDVKSTILIGLLGGFLSAFASTFPGGELPNIIEKILTSLYVYLLIKLINNNYNIFNISIISLTGTFISGFLFLYFANLIVGLPIGFKELLISVVIPATIINGIGTVFLYKIVSTALKHTNFDIN